MRFLLPLAALALIAAPPAAACSRVPGYRVPTNMELVQQADLILLARVSEGDVDPDGPAEARIAIEPLYALKGAAPAGPLTLAGMVATEADAALSNPYEFDEAHPQSYAGACIRYAFPRGSRVLFFLSEQDGHWRPAGGPFSRWAEDALSDDAPWLELVRFYLEVSLLADDEREAALAKRRDLWRGFTDDPVAQLLAADIDRQLAGPRQPLREGLPPAPAD